MSTLEAFKTAGSALKAQAQRMNSTASNIANAETASSTEAQSYKAKRVVFEAVLKKQGGASVVAKEIVKDKTPAKQVFDPNNPLANENGYVFMPDINPAEEMVDMISASRNYQTNVEVMNTSKQMMLKALSIGQ